MCIRDRNKGDYRADAYVVDNSGKRHYIAEQVVSVDYVRPSGVLTIENNNPVAGTFDAVVSKIVAPTGLKAVSYTHLDVYKRQLEVVEKEFIK